MQFTTFVSLALLSSLALAAPTLEERMLSARKPNAHGNATEISARGCYVPSDPSSSVLNTLCSVAQSRGCSSKMILAIYETCLVESNCNNISCGDGSSVGVFQQVDNGYWGTYSQRMDVGHAAGRFIDDLIPYANSHPSQSAGQWAQGVQGSQRPDAYATKAGQAAQLQSQYCSGGSSGGGDSSGGAINVGTGSSSGSSSSGSSSCKKHHTAKKGDTCSKLAKDGGISLSTFYKLNKSVNSKCTNLQIGKSYCIKN